jgi:hypothetical protein
MAETKSFVKAAQEFFTKPPFGKKVEISEFKELTTNDKIELSELLNKEPGYEHEPYLGPKVE